MSKPPKSPFCPKCKPKTRMVAFTRRTSRGELVAGHLCPGCIFRRVVFRARGILCRQCGGHRMYVQDTVRAAAGVVFRYYRCTACGDKTRTREKVDQPAEKPKARPGPARAETPLGPLARLAC